MSTIYRLIRTPLIALLLATFPAVDAELKFRATDDATDATEAQRHGSQRIRVLLDTDANNELDDQHAIAYMLFNGGAFDVEGITVNRTKGGGGIDEQMAEAVRVVKLSGLHGRMPVLKGADGSFEEIAPHVGKPSFDGSDAVRFIIEKAHERQGGRLVLIPVGKLTNIALALKKDPSIAKNVRIVWLGSNYPEPGEYNQVNDEPALQYVLNADVPFEIALVRYGRPSGTDAVRVTRDEIRARVSGKGPRVAEAVEGRHGGRFQTFGDYSVNLFDHIELHGNPPSRALYDMAAVAIVKNPAWAAARRIPAPQLVNGKWAERPGNKRTITLWENFDRASILEDFYRAIEKPLLAGEVVSQPRKTVRLTTEALRDKIKGGWAGQTIGVTFGGPTEFRYRGTMIPDYTPIAWHAGLLKESYERSMGLYDDVYVDLTFVGVIEKHGIDAPAERFADAFATASYQLWHANQMARYNLLRGMKPPASGHWRNNPEADDIDFQIESDFIGLMSPGMPNAASAIADRVGHIMNSGDGWYGGVYMAAMYSLAFTSSDIKAIVKEGLEAIPAGTRFHDTIAAVIALHEQHPDDWKRAWFEIQRRWAEDVACVEGVFSAFNIDARLNAAYVVLGLLYGQGDMTKTISIATRAGQDSDCNPSSAAGILGATIGYSKIPAFWKQGLADVEPIRFPSANLSLADAYELSYKHALAQIRANGGEVAADHVMLPVQPVQPVRVERNFEGHFPIAEITLRRRLTDETTFTFEGIGFMVQGSARSESGRDQVILADVYVDDRLVEQVELPTSVARRRYVPFWKYELPQGKHTVRLKIRNPSPDASVTLERVVVYGSKPVRPPV